MNTKPDTQSIAYEAGFFDGFISGVFNCAYCDQLTPQEKHDYKCGYDAGMTAYADANPLD